MNLCNTLQRLQTVIVCISRVIPWKYHRPAVMSTLPGNDIVQEFAPSSFFLIWDYGSNTCSLFCVFLLRTTRLHSYGVGHGKKINDWKGLVLFWWLWPWGIGVVECFRHQFLSLQPMPVPKELDTYASWDLDVCLSPELWHSCNIKKLKLDL